MHSTEYKQAPARIAAVEEAISKASGVSIDDMRNHNRHRPYSEARMAVWLVARDHLHYSYPVIGRIYERDHTTIMSGVKRMRSAKVSEKILEGIRKVCPEVLTGKPAPGEPRSIDDWHF